MPLPHADQLIECAPATAKPSASTTAIEWVPGGVPAGPVTTRERIRPETRSADSRVKAAGWVVRHGLRTLVKRGEPAALQLIGATMDADIRLAAFTVDRARIEIGDAAAFTFTLTNAEEQAADAVIDYRVHYVGARGVKAP